MSKHLYLLVAVLIFGAGFALGRWTGDTRDEAERETAEESGLDLPGVNSERAQSPPSTGERELKTPDNTRLERADRKRRLNSSKTESDSRSAFKNWRRVHIQLSSFDALGKHLGTSPAAKVDLKDFRLDDPESLILAPLAAIEGAKRATIVIEGESITVKAIAARSTSRGLVLLRLGTSALSQRFGHELDRELKREAFKADEAAWLFATASDSAGLAVKVVNFSYRQEYGFDQLRLMQRFELESGAWLVDEAGRLGGFLLPSHLESRPQENAQTWCLSSAGNMVATFEPIDLSLREYYQNYFVGSLEALIKEAQEALEKRRFATAIRLYRQIVTRSGSLWDQYHEALKQAHLGAIQQAARETQTERRLDALQAALDDFQNEGKLWLDLAQTRLFAERFDAAIEAFQRVLSLDAGLLPQSEAVFGGLFLTWAKKLVREGRVDEAIAVLERGLGMVRDNPQMWLLSGELNLQQKEYRAAIRDLELALSWGASPEDRIRRLIAKAERFAAGPGKVVIDYEPGSRAIIARVAVNGVVGDFIVDTGATSSWVPLGLAQRAGLNLAGNHPTVKVRTAGNTRILPYIPLKTLAIGKLAIEGVSVIVGDIPGMGQRGLLGMDFLGSFGLENDAEAGRLVLSEKH